MRLAPRLDSVLLDGLRRIGDDKAHVELDDVAEAVADRARAEGIVEGEQTGLRHLVLQVAAPALEPLGETVNDCVLLPRRPTSWSANAAPPPSVYAISIESVSRARTASSIFRRSTITCSVAAIAKPCRIDVLERHRLAVEVQAAEALSPKRRQHLRDRIDEIRQVPAAA